MPSHNSDQKDGDAGSNDAMTTASSTTSSTSLMDVPAAQRFPAWMCLTVCSAVCLAALQARRGIFDTDGPGQAWVLSVCIMSFLLSLTAVVLYLIFCRSVFVGQIPEVAMTSLLLAFWAAALPTIMNPANNIAVSNPSSTDVAPTVTNANLYFFAWLAFGACLFLSGSLAQEWSGVSLHYRDVAIKAARWYGLAAAALVVTGSAVRTYRVAGCHAADMTDTEFCRRSKFAVGVGITGFVLAGGMTYLVQLQKQLTRCTELSFTTVQLVMWCFGVGYITFGTSPGSTIGNLYFGTWISFLLTVLLFAVSFREYVAGRESVVVGGSTSNNNNNHHETIRDNEAPEPVFDDPI